MLKGQKLDSSIGIFCSSNPLAKDRTELGLTTIDRLGFKTFFELPPYKYYADYSHGFTNGSSQERLESIIKALARPDVNVLLASRGGVGALDLLSKLPISEIRNQRKIFVGQSDVTILLLQSAFKAGIPAIFGPTLGSDFANYFTSPEAKESVDSLIEMLTSIDYRLKINGDLISKKGEGRGRLLGGNLSMLTTLLGTEFDVEYSDTIVFIEEVGEPPYKIQRMLKQLLVARKFDEVKGVCFGRFAKCDASQGPSVQDVILTFSKELSVFNQCPIVINLPFGHWGKTLPLPLGIEAEIVNSELVTLESPIG